jgi:hypothetical protein
MRRFSFALQTGAGAGLVVRRGRSLSTGCEGNRQNLLGHKSNRITKLYSAAGNREKPSAGFTSCRDTATQPAE